MKTYEIRDPIHVFVKLDDMERAVLDSRQFQRLRHIHQLALTYLVYPGTTHKRFDHSLGVMELAGRVFDVITNQWNIGEAARSAFHKEIGHSEYWRRALRMSALCHDLGHLPFSHSSEDLLPENCDHEELTKTIILSDAMQSYWDQRPTLHSEDIVTYALGPKKLVREYTSWDSIMSEVIVSDALGVDRMDYLLRDSHYAGVAYGRFDQYRLIDTLRILPSLSNHPGQPGEFELGVEEGGIQSAEALLLARYFMFSQVYLHPVRRIYDIHLRDFLKEWLADGVFPTSMEEHLRIDDNHVNVALMQAASDPGIAGHLEARRIVRREHFKVLYSRNDRDSEINPEAGRAVFDALVHEYGADLFRHDRYRQGGRFPDFPVRLRNGDVVSSLQVSNTLRSIPSISIDYVFADRNCFEDARRWLESNKRDIIAV